jgi:hypothetical protein
MQSPMTTMSWGNMVEGGGRVVVSSLVMSSTNAIYFLDRNHPLHTDPTCTHTRCILPNCPLLPL